MCDTDIRLFLTHGCFSIYSGIDPARHFVHKTYRGKVVLVTGASRGIGQEIALFYARSGASLALLAREQSTLDNTRTFIAKDVPGVSIATFVADVCDLVQVRKAVEGAVEKFGKLDIVIANAGKADLYDKRLLNCISSTIVVLIMTPFSFH